MTDLNPQARQMADESMVRTLAAQTEAIWPQESQILERYGLPADIRILDAGCGTGEASSRLAAMFPNAEILGVDILDSSLEIARSRYPSLAPRLRFENRSIYELGLPDDTLDLTVNRHVLHSIPYPERVLAELVRVTRPGGRLHLIPEDYGMIHFPRHGLDTRRFWLDGPAQFGDAMGTDLFVGRHVYGMLLDLGITDITIDYVVVDTLRVPRETFAAIFEAWRDGYVDPIAEHTSFTADEARATFDQMIGDLRDPKRYAVWM
ncbi:MAG: class I SAM-dependent methyltransferase, partial [Candidatus Eisenbacteria bacterium]|nr:class I SAM-dependent methyltransferase [Candidatus Eisenbacteria bacterium]